MKSSVFYYCAFCIIVISTVMFGLDWQPATMSAMPDADVAAYVAPVPTPKPVVVVATPPAPAPAAPAVRNANAPPVNSPPANPPQGNPPVAQTPSRPLCDVVACATAYRSFRESDCTFNPSFGPRQLCTKGVVPTAQPVGPAAPVAQTPPPEAPSSIVAPEPGTQPVAPQSNVACNVSVCAAAYRSFRESDCTFNPSFGPRQVCKK